jgi:serine/threonine-protein kinase
MDPLIGMTVLGRYEVMQRIGSGGMGSVYVGRQQAIDRKVALKVLRTDLMNNEHVRMRFKREADIIAKLKHPNTIQLIDYGETEEGLAIMVMELLNGLSLSERLKTDGPLGMLATLKLGEEVCASLAEAHLYGLVHRDLKPANIFLNEVGREVHAKVLDFGIARLLDEESTRLTSTGQVFGTPRYMSPEQAMSTADVDPRSDLYSLGLILYECIVGQPPFVAQTSIQYLSAHSTQEPPKLREHMKDAPVELEALIDRCLAKNPEDRPGSAEEVGALLKQLRTRMELGSTPGIPIHVEHPHSQLDVQAAETRPTHLTKPTERARPADESKPPPKPSGSSGILVGLGVAVLGAALGGGWFFLKDRPAPVETPIDSGMRLAMIDEPDAGQLAEVEEPAVDAGVLELDAGVEATVVDEPPPPAKRPKKRRQRDGNPAGDGAIQGPRGIVIEGVEDEGTDLVALAKGCSESKWRGLAKLTTKGCPSGCAIVVDEMCAGQTPAEDRPISSGRRNITVVCQGKARRTATIRFEDDETTVFRCK